jgi:hypothetical protein
MTLAKVRGGYFAQFVLEEKDARQDRDDEDPPEPIDEAERRSADDE